MRPASPGKLRNSGDAAFRHCSTIQDHRVLRHQIAAEVARDRRRPDDPYLMFDSIHNAKAGFLASSTTCRDIRLPHRKNCWLVGEKQSPRPESSTCNISRIRGERAEELRPSDCKCSVTSDCK